MAIQLHSWPRSSGTRIAWALEELAVPYDYSEYDAQQLEDRSKAAAEYSLSEFVRCLDVLQARLDGREYVLGAFTLVDIACASWLRFGTMFGVALDGHPRVAAWLPRCSQRPALARAR